MSLKMFGIVYIIIIILEKIDLLPSITEDSQYKSKNLEATKEITMHSSPTNRESNNHIKKDLWFANNKNLDSSLKLEKDAVKYF
jgi:hypothetical protein